MARSAGRQAAAALWPFVWLLLGILVGVVAPARSAEHEERSRLVVQDPILRSAGVPVSADWVVLDRAGTAAWRSQGETRWQRFARGEVLPPGCEIETGSDGEVTLAAGGDRLTIAAQSKLIVPVAEPRQDRRLRHERGRILVQVEARAARDVQVDTPLLSLGIKGTTFEIAVDPAQNSVLVHEGEVVVTTSSRPDPVALGAGQGLRQPAASGSAPVRFARSEPDGPAASPHDPVWHLPLGGTLGTAPDTRSDLADARSQADPAPGDPARPQASSAEAETAFGWIIQAASSWGTAAVAAVALLILTIPALALWQNLREQWLDRPGAKGQRRRHLVRG